MKWSEVAAFLKRWGKWIGFALATIFGVILGLSGRGGKRGGKREGWAPIEGDRTHVLVYTDDGPLVKKLPKDPATGKQITVEKVESVHYEPGRPVKVEVLHEAIDRRR